MKLDAHIENMYSMSSDLKMSTMKSDAWRAVSPSCTTGSAVVVVAAGCASATDACFVRSAAAAPVAAPVRKLRRSTRGFSGSSMWRYPTTGTD